MQENAYAFRGTLSSDLEEAGRMLKLHPVLIDFPVYGSSESALHFFAVENRLDIIKWLLARGANPDGVAQDDSPLLGAAQLGHEQVCRELIKAGANVDKPDYAGDAPLKKASGNGFTAIVKMLLAAGADPDGGAEYESPLLAAVEAEKEDACKALIEGGADVNKHGYGDDAPLHIASARGNLAIIKMLLAAGADTQMINFEELRPVDVALPERRDEVLAVFEKYGACG